MKDAMRSVRAIDPRLQHAADVDKASCCFLAFNQESDDHQRLDFRDFNQAISFEHFETVSELRARAGESDLCKITPTMPTMLFSYLVVTVKLTVTVVTRKLA